MAPLRIIPLLCLVITASAARLCANLTIPVHIDSRQAEFKEIPIKTNFEIDAFVQDFTRRGQNLTQTLLKKYATLKGASRISARWCRPENDVSSTVQLLSHGIGFDKTYWDLSYNSWSYSYTAVANDNGYSTLAIDRFGIGNSSHGDSLNEIQTQAEVEALNEITTMLRSGTVPGITHKFDKVVHVGHSFGSIQSYWLSALYPMNTDGLVLTGFSPRVNFLGTTVAAWNLHNAYMNQPFRLGPHAPFWYKVTLGRKNWKGPPPPQKLDDVMKWVHKNLHRDGYKFTMDELWELIASTEVGNIFSHLNASTAPLSYPTGYLTTSSLTSSLYTFLNPGFYDIGLAVLAEQTKQPVTVGELLTLTSFPSRSRFKGPVFVFDGDKDQPFCGGDCRAPTGTGSTNIAEETKSLFPANAVFGAYLQPNTAHAINLHYNSTAGYLVIQRWLADHGLGP